MNAPPVDLSTLSFAPEDMDSLFLSHPSPAFLYDAESARILAANRAAEELYGWSAAELVTMSLRDIRPPEARPELQNALESVRRERSPRVFHTVHWRRTGEPMMVDVFTTPMQLGGRPIMRAVVVDVSARSQAEALFHAVAEQAYTGIYVLQDDRFIYLNSRLAEMFGYSVRELLSAPHPLSLLGPEAGAEVQRRLAARAAGFTEDVHYRLQTARRDGTPITVEIQGSVIRMHGRSALLGTVLDVTERERAAAALAESESRFRAAFDQNLMGMALTAPDGRWFRVNAALTTLLGYSQEELCTMRFQDVTHPDDLAENLALKRELMSGEIPGYAMDKRFIRKDGEVVWASLQVSPVRDEKGEVLYLVGQMLDVTARKRAEITLKESEAQLRQAQKMEAVGRLAGGVAHDFNNLLTVIGSNADLGAEFAREGLCTPDEFAEIRAAVDRAAALTRQLLAFSRRQVLAPEPLSLNDVVLDAQRMLRRLINEDVTLVTELDDAVGDVVADRGQLEQALMNLVVNARDAMPEGGRVVIATHRDDDEMVSLSVSDNGAGMDAATRARAFEPFFTTKPPGKGTGLGLSTVYGIAQQSGGDVRIVSELGHGTTVTLSLPQAQDVAAAEPAEEATPSSVSRGAHGGETILLVEDEAGVRAVARKILTRFGYRVIEAPNGADALYLWSLHRARVSLIVTDAVMPLMGGRELAERLREVGSDTPILFMSGYADEERGGDVPAGAELIGKPFSAEAFGQRVRELLNRR